MNAPRRARIPGCTSGGSAKYPFNLEASVAHEGRLRRIKGLPGSFRFVFERKLGIANPLGIPPAISILFPLIKSADRMFTEGFPERGSRTCQPPHLPIRPSVVYSRFILLWDIHCPAELTLAANSWICWLSRNSACATNSGESASSFSHVGIIWWSIKSFRDSTIAWSSFLDRWDLMRCDIWYDNFVS